MFLFNLNILKKILFHKGKTKQTNKTSPFLQIPEQSSSTLWRTLKLANDCSVSSTITHLSCWQTTILFEYRHLFTNRITIWLQASLWLIIFLIFITVFNKTNLCGSFILLFPFLTHRFDFSVVFCLFCFLDIECN